jgi:hypothetical protein
MPVSILILLLAAVVLPGCTTSTVTAFRDPAYETARFSRLAVFAHGMNLGAVVQVERQVCQKVAPTPCRSGRSILPPTREYSVEAAAQFLDRSGVDAVLVAALVSDQSETRYFGTITTSTATLNFYGNTALWTGVASVRSVSTPTYGYSRVAFGQLGLFDRATGNIVWRGEIRVTGQGALSTTDDAFIGSATSQIAAELKAAGLVR